ncbi:MAG: exonuclease SbcCD subunit D [Muribaculaceae bacterium]|nr:exonuclease SbcCD subunit D [Muribaculaceae bacterium]
MKIIHTSDWHLGHVLYDYDRSNEQRDMLRQIAELARAEQPDALLVSGDIYHNAAPTAAAQQLLVEGMMEIRKACPTMRIIVIGGNHDSASRLEAIALLWELADVTIRAHAGRTADGEPDYDHHIIEIPGKGWVVAVPHIYPFNFPVPSQADVPRDERQQHFFQSVLDRVAQRNIAGLPVVLMAHLAVSGGDFTGHDSIGTIDTTPIESLGTGYDYAALGHIHRPQTLDNQGRVRYCGTPLPVNFDEQCEHSVSIVTLNGHQEPTITTHNIKNIHPLHTLPAQQPVPLEEALQLLADFSDTEPAYLRLNILCNDYVPSDARDRAAAAVKDKACRFCTLNVTSNSPATTQHAQMSLEQFKQLNALEVAQIYILNKTGQAMTQEQEDMLKDVITNLQMENNK